MQLQNDFSDIYVHCTCSRCAPIRASISLRDVTYYNLGAICAQQSGRPLSNNWWLCPNETHHREAHHGIQTNRQQLSVIGYLAPENKTWLWRDRHSTVARTKL
eukprot:1025496-Amphidinium_carterae.1